MKKVLVVGGTGYVGTQVCKKLLSQGWQVTVPTRSCAQATHLQGLVGLTLLEIDVHDEAAFTQAVAGHDAVVNLVAILHGDQAAFDKVHVALPQKLARACRAAKIKRVVHISALGAHAQDPQSAPSMYLRSKGQGEAVLIEAAGAGAQRAFDLTILRPSVIFGAQDKFLNVFAKLQKVLPFMPLAGAEARFQPVWVDDVASAVALSLAQEDAGTTSAAKPKIIEACGPEVFTLRQLVQLAAQLSGVRGGRGRPVMALPLWLGHVQAALMALAPGEPVMSHDNLDSMKVDNVASGALPGLQSFGITPAALRPIAQSYLNK
ncbi:MAG: complex I NDUFA9 subunit family protein [Gammaproteobacteria bacterium]|uniref:complex I NDUFA9 subunit family protein n=1 Tax=Rhodoferax sp. TaxID=50421 RepID=UPI0017C91762|nr:complex I NDUFA9 subunit family protein [Rhodoferax sp.]MBU3898938.1 complex I NDUFA9 subunit family protein [Gammaproteobacteria bacterium]MBA3059285.1 complex I NDUFA9 subunit family protein [Rhodoferax sp.]MBU3997513.1 complex I NDUFA9 subunit family protein [Gammaproteobacteria bacterium]MBU4018381.1 complex I NDUFA9 subunit family protein [Gammaproteobacteria bacterium]MBU4080394.1 complex I NDUFA9 subunit family protein [Gammaproteobacteria bacterium]